MEKQIERDDSAGAKEEQAKDEGSSKRVGASCSRNRQEEERGVAVEYGACEFIASNDGRICSGAYGGGGWI
ncbi:MAG: hypothetical protein ACLTN0_06130 [Coprococcus phoceensis]